MGQRQEQQEPVIQIARTNVFGYGLRPLIDLRGAGYD
jgi:hypothetical protein